jgi:glucose/arabinose dehydrogenase
MNKCSLSTMTASYLTLLYLSVGLINGCAETSSLPISAGTGPNPTLPSPQRALIPTVNIAPATGWANGAKPQAAPGTKVSAWVVGLDHPRWLYVLPNGDVLVAESNAPPKPDDGQGIKGWIMRMVMKKAGAGVASANRISLFRDSDGDGIVDIKSVLLKNLESPFGMSLINGYLYVANAGSLMRFPYTTGDLEIKDRGTKLLDLPGGPINHHWTKNILASRDQDKIFITVGSNSNVAERGLAAEKGRASIWQYDLKSGTYRIFASGLRNANGLSWEPETNALWTVVNERDELGNDLVPDYLTSVKDGGFYGWPWSYFGQHQDVRVTPPEPEKVKLALIPDYALGAHTASLGLAFSKGTSLPRAFSNGMFIGQHGSWNRKPHSGYKVIFVPFRAGKPSGQPVDVLTGFLSKEGNALGRPVGVALDKQGALLVADDVGNTIWRISSEGGSIDERK